MSMQTNDVISQTVNNLTDGLLDRVVPDGARSGDPVIAVSGGEAGDAPILNAGVLNDPGDSPVDVVAGSGENVADVGLLGGNGGADGSLISADAGESGGAPILDAGLLTASDGGSPVSADIGNGPSIMQASLLSHSDVLQLPELGGIGLPGGVAGDGSDTDSNLISADAGAAGGETLIDAGVLAASDSGAPVNADIGSGPSLADASLLSQSDALQLPDLGGAGTDALPLPDLGGTGTNALPLPDLGGAGTNALQFADLGGIGTDTLTGTVPSEVSVDHLGEVEEPRPRSQGDQAAVDLHTDHTDGMYVPVVIGDDPNVLLAVSQNPVV